MSTRETSAREAQPPRAPQDDSDANDGTGTITDSVATLRRFHLTGRGAPGKLPEGLLPPSLHTHRDPLRVRDGYPLFLPAAGDAPIPGEPLLITDLLREAYRRAVGETDVPSVADNLDRLELAVRRAAAGRSAPLDATETLAAAAHEMLEGLGLRESAAAEAREGVERLLAEIPAGRLVPCAPETPLHLLAAVHPAADGERARGARDDVARLAGRLAARLETDHAKRDSGRTSEAVGRSLGVATERFFDPASVAKLMGKVRGAVPMSDARRARMARSLESIRAFLDTAAPLPLLVTTAPVADALELGAFEVARTEDPFRHALERARAAADDVVALCRAIRHARLELDGRYVGERHDEWLDALDAESLDEEERALLAPVLVVVREEDVAALGIQDLSAVLASPWPIAVVVLATPLRPLDARGGVELGYFGVAHRRAFVQQASIAHPVHMHRGFVRALCGARPSLHVVDVGEAPGGAAPIGRWLRAAAATEGRAHPLFRYDPGAGADWAARFDLDGNPATESPWSSTEVLDAREDGSSGAEVAFTFADLALLEPTLREGLAPAPLTEDDAFVSVDRYLDASAEERAGRVPFVWAADPAGERRRLAVAGRICRESAERRDFWHTLQELAGIRNAYVDRAETELRRELGAETEERIRKADEAHEEALDRVRAEAAADALDGLARFLVGMDAGAVLTGRASPPPAAGEASAPGGGTAAATPAAPAPPSEEAEVPAGTEEAVEESEVVGVESEDPWIETALCTSCNDCTNINSKLFIYDGNKQAHIGDPDAGTFAELVMAAEKCPARCIHPGTPRNPDEPNLDELRRRAAPFNS